MLKLTDLINNASDLSQSTPSSQFAMHGLKTDDNGLLTYTKVLFANTEETIEMTNGEGFAYNGLEEMIRGTTDSGVIHNTIRKGDNEIGDKINYDADIYVKVINGQYVLNYDPLSPVNLNIRLARGSTYRFIVEDPSTQGYPLYITTNPNGADYSKEYVFGVTNSRASYGGSEGDLNSLSSDPLIFSVPNNCPDVLYYASGNHSNVYGSLMIDRGSTNLKNRNHDQVRFDSLKLTYYINNRGFLVARYNSDYDYSNGPV